jgi:hypothetical protein
MKSETSSNDQLATPMHKWFEPLVQFFVHSIVGTVIFLIIFAPAIVLNIVLHSLQRRYEIDRWLIWGATAGEIMLAVADILLYLVFLIVSAWEAAKELIRIVRSD